MNHFMKYTVAATLATACLMGSNASFAGNNNNNDGRVNPRSGFNSNSSNDHDSDVTIDRMETGSVTCDRNAANSQNCDKDGRDVTPSKNTGLVGGAVAGAVVGGPVGAVVGGVAGYTLGKDVDRNHEPRKVIRKREYQE